MNKKVIAIIMYLISFILLCTYAVFQISDSITMTPLGRVIILVLSCIFMYIGAIILSRVLDKHKKLPFKINLAICFILYIILLSTLTLFDDYFRRGSLSIAPLNRELLKDYLNTSFNMIPFKTINMYFARFFDGYFSVRIFMYNIIGNIVALMPFAFFLPLLFKSQNRFKIFFITMIIVVALIEGLQVLTLSGSCDIDDFILNVGGACLLYAFLSIKTVKNFLRNIFLLENNKINYFILAINIAFITLVFILFGILINWLINF